MEWLRTRRNSGPLNAPQRSRAAMPDTVGRTWLSLSLPSPSAAAFDVAAAAAAAPCRVRQQAGAMDVVVLDLGSRYLRAGKADPWPNEKEPWVVSHKGASRQARRQRRRVRAGGAAVHITLLPSQACPPPASCVQGDRCGSHCARPHSGAAARHARGPGRRRWRRGGGGGGDRPARAPDSARQHC